MADEFYYDNVDYDALQRSYEDYAADKTASEITAGNLTGLSEQEKYDLGYYSADRLSGRVPDMGDSGTSYASSSGYSGYPKTRYASGAYAYGEPLDYKLIGTRPTYESPTFTAPERDDNRLSSLRTRASGSALRGLRTQTQSAIQSSYGLTGQARRMTLKEALQGYGSGVSSIMSQADRIARSQYEDEYDNLYKTSLINYQGDVTEAQTNFEAKQREFELLNKYQALMRGYSGGRYA